MVVLRIGLLVAGIGVVGWTLLSMVRTVVVPRGEITLLTLIVFRPLGRGMRWLARRATTPQRRDRIMTLYAPIGLVLLPGAWATILCLGFMAIFIGLGRSAGDAFLVSGSSLLTLGFAPVDGLAEQIVAFSEATIGLGVVALLITFLPSIYASYSRRATMVSLLEVRAGNPPSMREFLIRLHRIGWLGSMSERWLDWERWFAEIEESHVSYPMLVFFRAPRPETNWLLAAGTILDSAAVSTAAIDIEYQPAAALCIRAGFLTLRRICDYFGVPYPADPAPTDPISIDRAEFDVALAELEAAGVPLIADRDQAWRDYAGWRVNYDAALLSLAELVLAPEAPWISDRPALGAVDRPPSLERWRRRIKSR